MEEQFKDLPVDVRDEVKRLVGMIGCPKRVRREGQRELSSRPQVPVREDAWPVWRSQARQLRIVGTGAMLISA